MQTGAQKVEGLVNHRADVLRLRMKRLRSGKIEEVPDNSLQSPNFFRDDAELSPQVGISLDPLLDGKKPHLHRRERIADLVGEAGRQFADGGQLLGNQELIAAVLQSRAGVADVRHQLAKVIAHHPQFVLFGSLADGRVVPAVELRVGDHAAEWKEYAVEEEP